MACAGQSAVAALQALAVCCEGLGLQTTGALMHPGVVHRKGPTHWATGPKLCPLTREAEVSCLDCRSHGHVSLASSSWVSLSTSEQSDNWGCKSCNLGRAPLTEVEKQSHFLCMAPSPVLPDIIPRPVGPSGRMRRLR